MTSFHSNKKGLFPLWVLACALIALTVAFSSATSTSNDVTTVKLTRGNAEPSISRLLLGSQYNYFSAPIRDRLRDENLLSTWREMPVTMLRYPGGTWADHYLWDNPEGSYYASGNAKSVVTPEQFIESCRAIGAEPIFQVNASMLGGEGSYIHPGKLEDIQIGAARAARWVREANKRKKWNVRYWEIGNEVWIWLKPEEYAKYVVEYSKVMRAVDPTIKIIACGLVNKVGPFKPTWLNFPDDATWSRPEVTNEPGEWNQALLDGAMGSFDYIAPHIYIDAGDEQMSPNERFTKTNALIHKGEFLQSQIDWKKKMGAGVQIAITEWASNFRQSVPVLRSTVPIPEQYYYSLGNGVNTGYMFGKIVESGSELAILHALDDFQTLWYWPKKELAKEGPLLHPIYYAMKIWGHHLGKSPLTVEVQAVPTIASEHGEYPAIYSYASEDEGNFYLVEINLDLGAAREVCVSIPDSSPGQPAELTWMKGKEIGSNNFSAWNGNAPEEVLLTRESSALTGTGLTLKLPPHSMVGVIIPKTKK